MSKPLVSVLTTCFNRESYIGQAIQSVLGSDYQNFELIVVDDHSTDNTLELVRQFAALDNRIRVYQNEKNLGDYNNRNRAASYAHGKYIKYLDSDDIIYSHGLGIMVESMERFSDAGFGLSSLADDDKPLPTQVSPRIAYLEHFGRYRHFDRSPGSAIIRRDIFNQVGGFSGKRYIGDYELWFKLARHYNLVKFQRDLCWDRTHSNKESTSGFDKGHHRRQKAVLDVALDHPECPLTNEDKRLIRKLIKKQERKAAILDQISRVTAAVKS